MKRRSYDIVIIGSGAGGGTVAQELSSLCRDGVSIAVLEKGPKLRDEEFTGREVEMAKALYEDGGGFLTAEQTMTLAFGSAYGGSTVVYTGTSLLPPEQVPPAMECAGADLCGCGTTRAKVRSRKQRPPAGGVASQRKQPAVHRGMPTAWLSRSTVSGKPERLPGIEPL